MNPLISVIVPCYNQAQYLDECLQSVLDQTYTDWECIIVNDGSPDHTEEVAKKWLEKDPRFRYIDKENGGLSSARNAGLKEAKGEWIQFLDSDDKINTISFELLTKIIAEKKVEIIGFSYLVNENNKLSKDITLTIFDNVVNGKTYIEKSFFFLTMACVYLYSKKLLIENNIKFKEGLIHEDDYFNFSLFKHVKSIINIETPLYYYTKNSNSLTLSKNIDHIEKRISSYFILIRLLFSLDYLDQNFIFRKSNAYFRNIIILLKITAENNSQNLIFLLKKTIYLKKKYNLKYPIFSFKDLIKSFFFIFSTKIYINLIKN